ncbi:MAG: NB-ARC domain-containing protein, partial [Intestinibacter sp.]|uniref:protein kinase domain-containing protein n=1 Tax=Intestinibacter sp. TaxID=1965304 RepID=UPI002A8329F7
MRQALKIGEKLRLSVNENEQPTYEYTIKGITGFGASCIVYEAYYLDSVGIEHLVRLKEFYPAYMEIDRNEDLNLVVKEDHREDFEKSWDLFREAYEKNTLFQSNLDTLNSTGNAQNLLFGNNTMYMVVNYNNGISYDKVEGENLQDIFQIGLALTKTIGMYHKYGYVHLDIKPENILKLPETNELIILFDFGSVESIKDIKSGKVNRVSYSENWAAPEHLQHKVKKICEATDIYSIGAVIFSKIMGRIPDVDDRKVFADWKFDLKNPLFEGVNPKVFRYIKTLFKKTLSSSVNKRYKNADELIEILEKLVLLSSPNEVYFKSNFDQNDNVFIGREEEMALIHDKLKNETDTVFLHGFGGIGKSVLAKQYAFLYKKDYDVVIFASYLTSLFDLVVNDREIPIANFKRAEDEKDEDYFNRKLEKICKLSDDRTLIIVDNFDVDEDEKLEDLINSGCKFIITTRNDFTDYNYHQIEIEEFKDIADLQALFYSYNKIDYSEDDRKIIDDIIEIVDRHTMTVELIAKQLRTSEIEPIILYDKLKSLEGITSANKDKVKLRKDKKLNNKSIMMHLEVVFNTAKLSDFEKYILMNMSLIANVKIDKLEFMKWCDIGDEEGINSLIDKGWMEFRDDRISLHQIIIDLIYNKLKPDAAVCKPITSHMTEMATMRIKNNIQKRNQYIKLIGIFADRISGCTVELAKFYNEFAELLSSRSKKDCFNYYDKAVDIYEELDMIGDELAEVCFNIGTSFVKVVANSWGEWRSIFDDDDDLDRALDNVIYFFDKSIEIKANKNGYKSLEVADEYIEIATVM